MPESKLQEDVGALKADVATLKELVSEGRERNEEQWEKIQTVIQSLSASVRILSLDVEAIKPLAFDYRDRREQAKGAITLGRMIWIAIGAIGGWVIAHFPEIAKIFGYRPGG